jgi:hypothetical protein
MMGWGFGSANGAFATGERIRSLGENDGMKIGDSVFKLKALHRDARG